MKFQSILYIIFLAALWILALGLKRPAARRIALLTASYFFYSTLGPAFLIILLASSIFNYAWGAVLRRQSRVGVLWGGLLVNILLLVSFKHLGLLLHAWGWETSFIAGLVAPIGLSFYTFQGMSYLLDIYRGAEEVKPTLVEFLLYMAFWPTVLAGPICRVGEMIPQFRRMANPTLEDVSVGSQRILFGIFMKVVLAELLAHGIEASEGVTTGFDTLSAGWSGVDVWFLALGFGFQLFFDFGGYSNIAIGSARLFGISLRENFNDPYLSTTPSEFWTRWHMSLSSWIRDYLFFPLATMRRKLWWRNLALVISMVVFGLWHGISATFFLWGLYNGLLLMGHRLLQQLRLSRPKNDNQRSKIVRAGGSFASWAATFVLITLGWVLFRANSLAQAGTMLRAVVRPAGYFQLSMRQNFYALVFVVVAGYFVFVGLRELLRWAQENPTFARFAVVASPILYAALILAILIWSRFATTFVYVQF
jgi:D-alanyl-lipoteichoic acid acyltransferase DltB (MBOAT superfamily)